VVAGSATGRSATDADRRSRIGQHCPPTCRRYFECPHFANITWRREICKENS
jgi:hypothetical protein